MHSSNVKTKKTLQEQNDTYAIEGEHLLHQAHGSEKNSKWIELQGSIKLDSWLKLNNSQGWAWPTKTMQAFLIKNKGLKV